MIAPPPELTLQVHQGQGESMLHEPFLLKHGSSRAYIFTQAFLRLLVSLEKLKKDKKVEFGLFSSWHHKTTDYG